MSLGLAPPILTVQPVLRIHCLGPFRVIRPEGGEQAGLGSRQKFWQVFKYLVAQKGTAVPTLELMETFWPGHRDPTETAPLRTAVSRLKFELEPGGTMYRRSSYLTCRRDSCSFNVNFPHWLDTEEFEEGCLAAHWLGRQDRAAATALYLRTLPLYLGDFLADDIYQTWTVLAREHYRRIFLDATKEAAAWLIEAGDHPRARVLLERALRFDPLVEEIHLLLMQALVGLREFAAAVEYYSYCSNLLYKELGLKPSAEMKRLYRQARNMTGDPSRALHGGPIGPGAKARGPLRCTPQLFRDLLLFERRRLTRNSGQACLVLLRVRTNPAQPGISPLEDVISAASSVLRSSDALCRLNGRRLALLLPATGPQGAASTLSHLRERIAVVSPEAAVALRTKVQEVVPWS